MKRSPQELWINGKDKLESSFRKKLLNGWDVAFVDYRDILEVIIQEVYSDEVEYVVNEALPDRNHWYGNIVFTMVDIEQCRDITNTLVTFIDFDERDNEMFYLESATIIGNKVEQLMNISKRFASNMTRPYPE